MSRSRPKFTKPVTIPEEALEAITLAICGVVAQHLPAQYHFINGHLVRATVDALERLPVSSAVRELLSEVEHRHAGKKHQTAAARRLGRCS